MAPGMSTPRPFLSEVKPLVIVSSADDNYFDGLMGSMLSALWSTDHKGLVKLIVLDPGLSPANRETLSQSINFVARRRRLHAECTFIPIATTEFVKLPGLRGENKITYARLLLPELLSEDSCVWIDSDMLIFKDLAKLPELGLHLIGGCRDTGVKYLKNDHVYNEDRDNPEVYLNAGFLKMNLKVMRDEDFTSRIVHFMTEEADNLRFHDQSALNTYCKGRKKILQPNYNYLCAPWYRDNEEVVKMVAVANIHYLGGDKPWMNSQRLSCLTRNVLFYHTMEILLDRDFSEDLKRVRNQCPKSQLVEQIKGLLHQKATGQQEGTEDRFQSMRELIHVHTGRYEKELLARLKPWKSKERFSGHTASVIDFQGSAQTAQAV